MALFINKRTNQNNNSLNKKIISWHVTGRESGTSATKLYVIFKIGVI
jgi:hypothetical protein